MKLKSLAILAFIPVGFCDATCKNEWMKELEPCNNIIDSSEIISCLIDLSKEKEMEYSNSFNNYLTSIKNSKEPEDKKNYLISLESRAKQGWDIYTASHCLSGVALHEKDSYGYNAKYYICLIEKLNQQIEYYKDNKF